MERILKSIWVITVTVWLAGCAHNSVTQSTKSTPVIHVVLLQFKPEVTPQQIDQTIEQSIRQLRRIDGVISVEAGAKVRDDRPVHIKDYQAGILVRLQDAAVLDRYGSDPIHQAFLQQHQALFAKIQVLDFASTALAEP